MSSWVSTNNFLKKQIVVTPKQEIPKESHILVFLQPQTCLAYSFASTKKNASYNQILSWLELLQTRVPVVPKQWNPTNSNTSHGDVRL